MYSLLYILDIIPQHYIPHSYEIILLFEIVILTLAILNQIKQMRLENLEIETYLIQENEQHLAKTILLQEKEKTQLSKELHNNIGQKLTSLKFLWFSIQNSYPEHHKHFINNTLTTVIDEVRSLSHQIMPLQYISLGLDISLEYLVKSKNHEEFHIHFEHYNLPDSIKKTLALNLYWVIQDFIFIANSVSTEMYLSIRYSKNRFIIEINYSAISQKNDAYIQNLILVENRIKVLNGTLELDENNPTDHNYFIRIPIN